MRSTTITILLMLLIAGSAFAQKFEAQLQAGINASQIDGDDLFGYNKPGILLGPLISFPFSDLFSVGTGILYSQKGSRYGKNDPVYFIQRLNYIEMPLTAQVKAFDQLSFVGGLTGNFLISAKADNGSGEFISNKFPDTRYPNARFNDIDICYTFGVNYAPFDRTSFQIRLVNGFGSSRADRYFKNRTLSFSMLFCLLEP